ncbi:MAG: hypothetical protein ABI624_06490 [Casimicrobiaceae bacterium]
MNDAGSIHARHGCRGPARLLEVLVCAAFAALAGGQLAAQESGTPPAEAAPAAPAGTPDEAPNAAPDAALSADFIVTETQLTFRGRSIKAPPTRAELLELLGSPSRHVEKGSGIDVWDALGIHVYATPKSDLADCITLSLERGSYDFSPHEAFAGRVMLPGGSVDARSTTEELHATGFVAQDARWMSSSLRLGACDVLLDRFDGDLDLSLSWVGPMPPPPPPLADDELFVVDARAVGCSFDETLREVRHRGNVSELTLEIHGSGGVVGRSMFVAMALGELAQRRGYAYLVMLGTNRYGEADTTIGDGKISPMIVGFTQHAEPDCAKEFPLDAAPEDCRTMPSDMFARPCGTWQGGDVVKAPAAPAESATPAEPAGSAEPDKRTDR